MLAIGLSLLCSFASKLEGLLMFLLPQQGKPLYRQGNMLLGFKLHVHKLTTLFLNAGHPAGVWRAPEEMYPSI